MAGSADPGAVEALFQRGLAEAGAGRHEDAATSFQQVLRLHPAHLGALVSLASAQLRAGRAADAERLYRQALEIAPGQTIALRNLGVLLNDAERHDEALALAEAALARDPASTPARIVQANALAGLGRPEAALAALQSAERAAPALAEIKAKIGGQLAELGRYEAAIEAMDAAIRLDPQDTLTRFRRAIVLLRLRRFSEGWPDYEQRLRLATRDVHATGLVAPGLLPHLSPLREPADVAGQRVLVIAEQGIGDQVMFASMLPDLISTAAAVTCVCDPRLVRLLSHAFPSASFVAPDGGAQIVRSSIDKVVALGSLGGAFRRREADFPGTAYLRPRAKVLERWGGRLGPKPKGLRIGLSWRGGSAVTQAAMRSVPLAALSPILALPGCEFVSLQYGDPRAEVAAVAPGLPAPIRLFEPEEISDFEDLAGLIANLDAVVSVQTSVAHLCGAIGAECLTLIARYPEWRYGSEGETLPWYRSVRLFRQDEGQAWPPVVDAVAAELSRRLG